MQAVQTVLDEILELKRERRAIILAHHYQVDEIQDVLTDLIFIGKTAIIFTFDTIPKM